MLGGSFGRQEDIRGELVLAKLESKTGRHRKIEQAS